MFLSCWLQGKAVPAARGAVPLDYLGTQTGHTPFLTLCAAYFRLEIADRPARPLHPVRADCTCFPIYCLEQSLPRLPGLAYHSSSVSSSSNILPCPPPTQSLILLILPNNYFVPSLLSNDCQRFYFITIPVKKPSS